MFEETTNNIIYSLNYSKHQPIYLRSILKSITFINKSLLLTIYIYMYDNAKELVKIETHSTIMLFSMLLTRSK